MGPFARGVAATVLVGFAAIGAASLLGVDVGLTIEDEAPGGSTPAAAPDTDVETATPTATATPAQGPKIDRAAVRTAFYERLNEFRATNDRANVSHDHALWEAARAYSVDMSTRAYFAHQAPDGSDFTDCVRRAGGSCTRGGENIAQTWWREDLISDGPDYIDSEQDLAQALFVQWRESDGHRKIRLTQGVIGAGLGVAITATGKVYATLVVC